MKPNILFIAPALTVSGYGSHSRDILKALWQSGEFNISLHPLNWGHTSMYDEYSPEMKIILKESFRNRISTTKDLICIHVGVPHEFQPLGKFNIGITAGLESTQLPESWIKACNKMNCLVVPSKFQKELFLRSGVTAPIEVISEGVDTEIFNLNKNFEKVIPEDINEKYLFLTTGQWMLKPLNEDRKQIGKLISFFFKFFENNKEAALIIKTMSLNNSSVDREMTKERIVELIPPGVKHPKIHFIHGSFTDSEMAGIYKHENIKGFISFTSGESWGRGIFEAAACGVPIIVPGWSGYMDFLLPRYSTLLDFTLQEIPSSNYHLNYFGPGHKWAVVNEEDAMRKLNDFILNYENKKKEALEFASIVQEQLSLSKTYSSLINLLLKVTNSSSDSLKLVNLK